MRLASCFLAATLWLVGVATFAAERVENAALYLVSENDGKQTLVYDGFRTAPIADDVVVSDATGTEIDSLAKLADALGKEPDWDALKLGDVVGTGAEDALVATVETRDGAVSAISVTERKSRPLVGVSIVVRDGYSAGQRTIVETLLRCGVNVYLIPKIAKEEECDEYLPRLDGFVMPGGTNANPRLFGEVPYPHGSAKIDDVRDVNDVLVTRWLIAHNVPGLWICRGNQFLNVALGGALIQDIPSYQGGRAMKGEIPADQTKTLPDEGAPTDYGKGPVVPCVPSHYRVVAYATPHGDSRHAVDVAENSKFLAPIIGVGVSPSFVSSHHQAADAARRGEGLKVVATAPDGIVEALEYQANDFALATQFHFESDVLSQAPERAELCDKFFLELLRFARMRSSR